MMAGLDRTDRPSLDALSEHEAVEDSSLDVLPDGEDGPDGIDTPDGQDIPVELMPITIDTTCAAAREVMGAGFRLDQCQDGAPDTGEKCDDGNAGNADGCDPYCLYETKVCDWAEPVGDPGDLAVEAGYAYVSEAALCVIIKINMGEGSAAVLAGIPGQ